MKKTIMLMSVLLVIALIVTIVALAETTSLPGNDTFDTELQPVGLMDHGGCVFKDQGLSIINTGAGTSSWEQGEKRKFTSSSSGASSTLDISEPTDYHCQLGTKRTRYGFELVTPVSEKLMYKYLVYPRDENCNFNSPQQYLASGCPINHQIGWNQCESCPEGYTFDSDCNCQFISPIIMSMIPGARFDISTAANGVRFDMNANGVTEKVATPLDAANVGFLYLDTGVSHDGNNLFGDKSPQANGSSARNGFKALAQWDDPETVNGQVVGSPDGKITAADGVWKNLLRVWFDLNRNGLADPGEKKTLTELGIESLDLSYTTSKRQDGHGNALTFQGRFWKTGNPQPFMMVDYYAAAIR